MIKVSKKIKSKLKLNSIFVTKISDFSYFKICGKYIEPTFIDRIQDSSGKTIFNSEKRICDGCKDISFLGNSYPKIKDNFNNIF